MRIFRNAFAMGIAALFALVMLGQGARAGTPATPIDVPDDSFTDVNPCTGAPTTIVVHYIHARFREDVDASGGSHVLFTGEGTYSGDDGFVGRFRNSVTFNTTAGDHVAHAYRLESDARRIRQGRARRVPRAPHHGRRRPRLRVRQRVDHLRGEAVADPCARSCSPAASRSARSTAPGRSTPGVRPVSRFSVEVVGR